jgi:hypothetical protein
MVKMLGVDITNENNTLVSPDYPFSATPIFSLN